jgi:hypothetical protein
MTVFPLAEGRLDGSVFVGATGWISFCLFLSLEVCSEAEGPAVLRVE